MTAAKIVSVVGCILIYVIFCTLSNTGGQKRMGGRDARRDALQQDKRKSGRKRHRRQFEQYQRRLSAGNDNEGNRRHHEATGERKREK